MPKFYFWSDNYIIIIILNIKQILYLMEGANTFSSFSLVSETISDWTFKLNFETHMALQEQKGIIFHCLIETTTRY